MRTFHGNLFTGYPTAQAVRGRMRWLARTIIAGLQGCGNIDTYTGVEKECFRIDVTSGDVTIRLGLVELLFGTINAESIKRGGRGEEKSSAQFKALFTLQVEPLTGNVKPWDKRTIHLSGQVRARLKRKGVRGYPDRYNALLSRATSDEERPAPQDLRPAMPGTVGFKLRVLVNNCLYKHLAGGNARLGGSPLNEHRLQWITAFYAGLALVTPTILGLGRGANRGFGRFRVVEAVNRLHGKPSKTVSEIIGLLKNLSSEEQLRSIINDLISLAEIATGSQRSARFAKIPLLVNTINPPHKLQGLSLKVVDTPFVYSVDDAIEAIALAVLKQCWKPTFKATGVSYHTWPLGLPRGASVKCVGGRDDRQRYGYYVFPLEIAQRIGNVECIHSNDIKRFDNESTKYLERRLGFKTSASNVRRQSMIVLFPLPGDHRRIAVLPFFASDLNLGVDSSGRRDLVLYHVGGHFYGRKPCCNVHAVNVGYASSNPGRIPPSRKAPSLRPCSCDWDDGGVKLPRGQAPGRGDYLDILRAAYYWILHCLRLQW